MSLLSVEGLTVTRAGRTGPRQAVVDVGFTLEAGEVVGLVGPNGAGKTTLMRAALGLLPHGGRSSLAQLAPEARARAAAWLPQEREIAWPVSVEALVGLGRTPYPGRSGRPAAEDRGAIDRAIARMGLEPLRHRAATRLSGGEQARALIARALAQETALLVADEPTAGLDPAHQIGTMEVFRALAGEGRGVLVSLHDLGLAARHCTRLMMLHEGRLVADGPPVEVLRPETLAAVFGIRAFLGEAEGLPLCQPLEVIG